MNVKLAPFDAASYLDSEETIAEYLTAAMEDENPDVLLSALADVAKARGMAQVARDAGLGRESSTSGFSSSIAAVRYSAMVSSLSR